MKAAPAAFISGTAGDSADAWFTEARIADLTERFRVRPRLTWYDT